MCVQLVVCICYILVALRPRRRRRRRRRERQRFRWFRPDGEQCHRSWTEASESCNLPRALSLGAAAFPHFLISQFRNFELSHFRSFLIFRIFQFANCEINCCTSETNCDFHKIFINFPQRIQNFSLCFTCVRFRFSRFSLFASSHVVLFLALLSSSSSSLFLVSQFRCCRLFRCCRVFRCHWPSSCSRSVEHGQRQWSSQGAASVP